MRQTYYFLCSSPIDNLQFLSYDNKEIASFLYRNLNFDEIGGIKMSTDHLKQPCISLEENLKKALTELLILNLLSQRDYFIGEITETLKRKSNGVIKLVFPYSAVYRLQEDGYILGSEKRVATDGRKRQFYSISQLGRTHYQHMLETYQYFISGISMILEDETT